MKGAPSLRALIGRESAATTMIISGDDPVSRGAQRFEVFTGAGKRREWQPEVKASARRRVGMSLILRRFTPGGGICGSGLKPKV